MVQEVEVDTELTAEPRVKALRGGYMMYYRQPNGHIAPASAQKMDMSNFIDRGWRPLKKYGNFLADHININRPLDHLFRKDGAKELPVSQLFEESWVYRDDYRVDGKVVTFPQLAGVSVPPLETCTYCARTGSHAQIESHLEVQHQKDLAPLKMGEQLVKAFTPLIGNPSREGPEAAEKIIQGALPGKGLPYICGICGDGFKGPFPLTKHIKKEHKDGTDAVPSA